jgi:hypothetical protein
MRRVLQGLGLATFMFGCVDVHAHTFLVEEADTSGIYSSRRRLEGPGEGPPASCEGLTQLSAADATGFGVRATGKSRLAKNMVCDWLVELDPEVTHTTLVMDFVHLPGATLDVLREADLFVPATPLCNCTEDGPLVCADGVTFANECTASCLDATSFKTGPCPSGTDDQSIWSSRSVSVYKQTDAEKNLPITIRLTGFRFLLRLRTTSTSKALGFTASMIDSSDGQCLHNCSDHGACTASGECECDVEWLGGYCSVHSPVLQSGDELKIEGLCVGCWQFASFEISEMSFVLVELMVTALLQRLPEDYT